MKTGGTLFEIDHVRTPVTQSQYLLDPCVTWRTKIHHLRSMSKWIQKAGCLCNGELRALGPFLQMCVLAWGESQRDIEMVIQILEQVRLVPLSSLSCMRILWRHG